MADGEALKRLGGGRWKTADDRFTVEPQSGSWVVVDAEQSDDLGLPLVRGPFASLTAVRAAIEGARSGEVPISPLAARVEEERQHPRPARRMAAKPAALAGPAAAHAAGTSRSKAPAKERPKPPEPPPPPPEPAWIGKLPPSRRAVARQLIGHLADADIPEAEAVARAEVVDGEPAVARLALARQLRRSIRRHPTDRAALLADVLALLEAGEDQALRVRWRLVDGEDRAMAPLPSVDPDGS
jgi:hypothetical protein